MLEEVAKGQLKEKGAIEAAQTALKLLGNASTQASRERRNAISNINTHLVDIAEEEEANFKILPLPQLAKTSQERPKKETSSRNASTRPQSAMFSPSPQFKELHSPFSRRLLLQKPTPWEQPE